MNWSDAPKDPQGPRQISSEKPGTAKNTVCAKCKHVGDATVFTNRWWCDICLGKRLWDYNEGKELKTNRWLYAIYKSYVTAVSNPDKSDALFSEAKSYGLGFKPWQKILADPKSLAGKPRASKPAYDPMMGHTSGGHCAICDDIDKRGVTMWGAGMMTARKLNKAFTKGPRFKFNDMFRELGQRFKEVRA